MKVDRNVKIIIMILYDSVRYFKKSIDFIERCMLLFFNLFNNYGDKRDKFNQNIQYM